MLENVYGALAILVILSAAKDLLFSCARKEKQVLRCAQDDNSMFGEGTSHAPPCPLRELVTQAICKYHVRWQHGLPARIRF